MKQIFTFLLFTFYTLFAVGQTFPIVYDFTTTSDNQGQYTGTLQNGAILETLGSHGILNLGNNDGYLDLGSQFGNMIQSLDDNFTISATIYVPTSTDISGNGNFIWCFSQSSTDGYMFINAKDMRYAITQSTWWGETSVNASTALPEGQWLNIIYEQEGSTGTVYLNNVAKAQNDAVNIHPINLSQLQNNYLGRSCYNGDAYLKNTRYADFRVYNTSLTASERSTLVETVSELNRMEAGIFTDEDAIDYDINSISIPKVAYKSINLPTTGTLGSRIT